MTDTMSQLTAKIQGRIGREDTLKLLVRCGQASRASKTEFRPFDVLELMAHRLEQGWTPDKIAAITNGKLIQLTRKHQRNNGG